LAKTAGIAITRQWGRSIYKQFKEVHQKLHQKSEFGPIVTTGAQKQNCINKLFTVSLICRITMKVVILYYSYSSPFLFPEAALLKVLKIKQ